MAVKIDKFLLFLLIASLGLNVYLGWTIKRQKIGPAEPQTSVKVVPGTSVGQVNAVTLAGRQETINYGDTQKPTVLYVFTPTCSWCEKNSENINAIASQKAENFRFVGLSLSNIDLQSYIESQRMAFPVYTNVAPESIEMLGLGATPQTIVIAPDGRVLKNWLGAYGTALQPQIEEFFGVRLPGMKG
jgi:peroxiredoxin